MKYYLAPLEGITGYLFRNAYNECFNNVDKYFTPFISPNQKVICRNREKKDIDPENNKGMYVVPQVLTNDSNMFIKSVEYLKNLGYQEININIGCPMPTVVTKKKGAGMLSDLKYLEYFLDDIYSNTDAKISIKTRIGMELPDQFNQIMEIYNKFPLYELIIHPRTREQYYKGKPDINAFSIGYNMTNADLCYNGDIFSKEDYISITQQFSNIQAVMLGRGILRYPGIIQSIQEKDEKKLDNIKNFHNNLYIKYKENLSGDTPVLYKMKELWTYMIHSFESSDKMFKKIKKCQRLSEYEVLVQQLFANNSLTQ